MKTKNHAATIAALMLATTATAEPYISINTFSHHFGATRDFNEFNAGIGLGYRWDVNEFRLGVSGGVFLNSYDHWATYVSAEADYRVIDTQGLDVYGGVFIALADYSNLVGYADKIGLPRVGSHIMLGGPSISFAPVQGPEVKLRCLIGGHKMDAVCTASLIWEF